MARAKQLTLSHENRVGMLAHIAQVLGDAKVIHLIVDNADKAKKAFARSGLRYREEAVPQLSDCAWNSWGRFAGKLVDRDNNITLGIIRRAPRVQARHTWC